MKNLLPVLFLTAVFSVLTGCVRTASRQPSGSAATPATEFRAAQTNLPGRQADGSVLLPNMWSLRPAGVQVELGDFPVNVALHPKGRFAAVLHSGYSTNSISIVDIIEVKAISKVIVSQSFYGLEFSGDGEKLFCSGAGDEVIHEFDFQDGKLTNPRTIRLREEKERGVPAGLVVDRAGRRLYAANLWGDRVTRVELASQPKVMDISLRTNSGPLLRSSGEAAPDEDVAAATKRAEAALLSASPDDAFPYACRLDEKRQRLYVSLWAQAAVAVIDLKSNAVVARWPTQEHPCEMVLTKSGRVLFVANANRNTVTVFDTASGKALETIWAALFPDSPPGSTPNSLTLSPDEKTLFVANANNNIVAVFDIAMPGKSRSLGFIPTGSYPTSVRVTPDGKRLLIANGKGSASQANPHGPVPGKTSSAMPTVEYIARLFRGTLSVIDLPPRDQFEAQLKAYTVQAYQCSPLRAGAGTVTARPTGNPVPQRPGEPSPIKDRFYIIKENRTYDQVLGDVPQGNGDAQLCLFPERVTPNHHKLARDFVLLDNFYAEAEVSADGHEWSMGAYASDFVEKTWPLNYGHNRLRKFPYPAEGNLQIATPASGYIWDRAREAGVSYRSYGEFVSAGTSLDKPVTARVKSLQGHIDPWYRGFDLDYADTKRAERFISELKKFEEAGEMPRLQIVRLGNDHTHGATRGKRTPTACVGDNDLAFGQILEALSHSRFWPETAVFVVEDDAQNGPDHVDAHRTIAFVLSPYTRRAAVDSTMYSTSSMLRTIELILGFPPMSQYDAAATPMYNSFQATPDLTPYTALAANVNLEERNGSQAWGGQLKMNFAREDAVDDLLLNEVVWRSVRGADNPMPAPVRAGFVFVRAQGADGDDD